MATNLESIQSEPSEKPKKESDGQGLGNSAEVQPELSSTDFSSQENNERELDSIREKIKNPKLRKPHETKEYLKQKEKLLLKNQKLLKQKRKADNKIEQLESEVKQQQVHQNGKSKNYLLFAASGIVLIGGIGFLGYLLLKKNKK